MSTTLLALINLAFIEFVPLLEMKGGILWSIPATTLGLGMWQVIKTNVDLEITMERKFNRKHDQKNETGACRI